MKFLFKWVALLLAFAPTTGRCGAVVDANIFYFSDTFAYDTTSTYNRTLWDFFVGMGLTKKNQYIIGWNYDSMSFEDDPGTPTKLSVTDMGPKFMVYFDKERTWVFGFTYDLITKGKYSSGSGTSTELRGSALKVEAGYTPPITETILMGFKINYYKASFAEKVIDTSITKKATSRTAIYPSLSFTMRWD
jgi:hypothetical protein